MEFTDKFCILSYDEMVINSKQDFNKFRGNFVGNVTMGNNTDILGSKFLRVLARGLKNPWKQIVACHETPSGGISHNIFKNLMEHCILAVEICGLHILALSSDLDARNRALWRSFGINISKYGKKVNFFNFNGHEVFAIADV